MPVPTVTLTPGAAAPGVGAAAGLVDDLALPLRRTERVCQWAGCHRAPVSAVRDRRGRVAVCAEHWRELAASSGNSRSTAVARASDPAYRRWAERAASAGGCTHPVRLQAESSRVDTGTGELVPVVSVGGEDDVIYKACGNRRAAVCPSCAETYRADAYQLVLAGLRGGKGIPDDVAGHPAIFATLTGPSFGAVHSRLVDAASGKVRACRPDRRRPVCPHGRLLSCGRQHAETDPRLGQPLCPDCYDYDAHAVWNAWARELWRRTTVALNRAVIRHRPAGAPTARVSVRQGRASSNAAVSCTTTPSSASTASTTATGTPSSPRRSWATVFVSGARAAGGVRRDPVRHSCRIPSGRPAGSSAGAIRTRAASTCGHCASPASG